jgi:hypothetical protein
MAQQTSNGKQRSMAKDNGSCLDGRTVEVEEDHLRCSDRGSTRWGAVVEAEE